MIVKYRHGYAWGYEPWRFKHFEGKWEYDDIKFELMADKPLPFANGSKYRGVEIEVLDEDYASYLLDKMARDERLLKIKLKMCRDAQDLIHTKLDRVDIPDGTTIDRIGYAVKRIEKLEGRGWD